jgi:hypothetical protein
MIEDMPLHTQEKHLSVAGSLALLGLLTALVYLCRPTPYTTIAFLGGGQMLIVAGAAIYIYVIAADIKVRLESVVEKRVRADDIVFRQGDFPDRLYVIGKGEVEVIREDPLHGEILLARLGAGEFFGEMGILGNTPRTATIRAVTDLELLSIHRTYFRSLFSYLPSLREGILAEYQRRRASLEERVH